MIASREFIIKKLAELITEPKKWYSQNFLTDFDVVKKGVDALLSKECDEVIEIGPGLGALTEEVLNRNVKLTAFEIDTVMVKHLESYFARRTTFSVVEGDFMKADLSAFKNKKIGNIQFFQFILCGCSVVLRTYAVYNASVCECFHKLNILFYGRNFPLAQCALPESIVEVPNDKLYFREFRCIIYHGFQEFYHKR